MPTKEILEARNDNGYTLLGLAVKRGDYLISEYLLSLGADPNTTNNVSISFSIVLTHELDSF